MQIKKNIVLIGAGQLGSRHLQGLSKVDISTSIYVIDPFLKSLETAKERFEEMKFNPQIESIVFLESFDGIPRDIDLAIIATNSNIRADVTKNFLQHCTPKFIIFEKFLFQQEHDYNDMLNLLRKNNINAWVNCPRRLFKFYQQFRMNFSVGEPIRMDVTGGTWGIGCNTIHYVDLLAFLNDCYDIEFDTNYLNNEIIESKRIGYKEFLGTIIGKQTNGSIITLNASPSFSGAPLITIKGDKVIATINENTKQVQISTEQNGWKWEYVSMDMLYQSQLTGNVASDLLSNQICLLTPFENSIKMHIPFMKAILKFYNKKSGLKSKICPIT